MNVILLGAEGMLARDLRATAPREITLRAYTRRDVDVTDEAALLKIIRAQRPQIIVNAAAYTRVDEAEANQGTAFAVNGRAPGVIGVTAADVGATVVHFSTDYIFDGRAGRPYVEEDPPNPLNVYGHSKLNGEIALRASGAAHLIVRSQWLFGLQGHSLPRTMWDRANAGLRTIVVQDQSGRPTYTYDLALAVWRLLTNGVTGTLHVANAGTATWFDVALRVFVGAHAEHLVSPCLTEEYPTRATRPRAAVLDTGKFERLAGGPLPQWEHALDRYLSAIASSRRHS